MDFPKYDTCLLSGYFIRFCKTYIRPSLQRNRSKEMASERNRTLQSSNLYKEEPINNGHHMSITRFDLHAMIAMFIQLLGLTFHSRLGDAWFFNLILAKRRKKQNQNDHRKPPSFLSSDYSVPDLTGEGGEVWGQFIYLSPDEQNRTHCKSK